MPNPIDALGVTIVPGDTITVIHVGAPIRLADAGRRALVAGFTPKGNVILFPTRPVHDIIANGRAVRPSCVAVARRDGAKGHEGNVDRAGA